MNIKHTLPAVLLLALAASPSAYAEDVELFITPSTASGSRPNVLFVLDNTANWNATMTETETDADGNVIGSHTLSKKDMIHEALYRVLTSPEVTATVRAGIMVMNSKGGMVLKRVRTLHSDYQRTLGQTIYNARTWRPDMTLSVGNYVLPSSGKWNRHYYKVVDVSNGNVTAVEPNWPTNGTIVNGVGGAKYQDMGTLYNQDNKNDIRKIVSYNNAPYALTFLEAYRYFQGLAPLHGTYNTGYDTDAIVGGLYRSPSAYFTCARNFIIFIGNGSPDSGENNEAESALTALGGKLSGDPIPLTPNNYQASWADEYARFMSTYADFDDTQEGLQGVNTYVIDVSDLTVTNKPVLGARALLASMGTQGKGGTVVADSVQEIIDAITKALNQVKSVNSVFASTTLPISVNVRGTTLNQVYMGVFRADPNAAPLWPGNLKMYQLGYDSGSGNVFLADVHGQHANSETTGFIQSDATSFWSSDSSYWAFSPRGTPTDPAKKVSDAPDGEVVEKGATAQLLRSSAPANRNLYTDCGGTFANNFTASNTCITAAKLGVADSATAANVINWVRGQDLFDENQDGSTTDMRAFIHGDVLHSRPAVINYSSDATSEDDVVVFYGANDGVFRAVKGGKGSTGSITAAPGAELWGFVPEEFYPKLHKLYVNEPMDYATTDKRKPYFADGTVGSYKSGDDAWIFITMRRGGRSIYALDVADPLAPTLKWKIDSSTTGFSELGQTWSDPQVVKIKGYESGLKPVLVFAGGYDPAEDANGANTMGRAIFFVDADTGALIKRFDTSHGIADSIPSAVTLIDRDSDPYRLVDRGYVADAGGNLWRLDLSGASTDDWTIAKMAALGGAGSDNRKFLYPPDVVGSKYGFDVVLIGSGDRENPYETTVQNRFFMLKDFGSSDGWPIEVADLKDVTSATTGVSIADLSTYMGWYINLENGEKVVGSALTLSGTTHFNTNVPATSSSSSICVPSLGTARSYSINYLSSAGDETGIRYETIAGGGFIPSPVPFVIETPDGLVTGYQNGTNTGTDKGHPLHKRARAFWYKNGAD